MAPDWFTEAHRARWNRTLAAMKGMGLPATAVDEVVLTNFVAAAVLAEGCAPSSSARRCWWRPSAAMPATR